MPLLALALLFFIPIALVVLFPLVLLMRYRAGRARRLARPWLASANLAGLIVSVMFFLGGAAMVSLWVPGALASAVAGLAIGCGLGVVGLWLTRWEETPRSLHYTPNRWLVLAITFVVAARVLYGSWRGWMAWQSTAADAAPLIAAFGVAGSMGAGAAVLGYYLSYAVGLRQRVGRWQRRPLRVAGPGVRGR